MKYRIIEALRGRYDIAQWVDPAWYRKGYWQKIVMSVPSVARCHEIIQELEYNANCPRIVEELTT